MEALLWPRKATNCGPATAGLGNAPRTHGSRAPFVEEICLSAARAGDLRDSTIQHLKRGVDYM